MDELKKELIKFNLLHNNPHKSNNHHRTTFTEILGLLIFVFMLMIYFKQNEPQRVYIERTHQQHIIGMINYNNDYQLIPYYS